MPKIYIGTSGWMYKHWGNKFYPEWLSVTEYLPYFSKYFETVEINSSFYHTPLGGVFQNWYEKTPNEFKFSVKLNRYITHRRRMNMDEKSKDFLKNFLENASRLKEKFSALLIQLPPSAKAHPKRLENFLSILRKMLKRKKYQPDLAIEFRHPSWFTEEVFKILRKHKVALVWAQSSVFIENLTMTTDFAYIRFHGPGAMFASNYATNDLRNWAMFMVKQKLNKIYVYFNNDFSAYAIDNAADLKKFVEGALPHVEGHLPH